MSTQRQSLPGDAEPLSPANEMPQALPPPDAAAQLEGPPPPVADTPERADWFARWWWLVAVLAVLATVGGGFGLWAAQRVPYYSLSPGSLYATTDIVTTGDLAVHQPEGEILFTTVGVSSNELTRFERWWLERDPDIDIVPREQVLGTRTRDENNQFHQRLMNESKQLALVVALVQLGVDVRVEGTGAAITMVDPNVPAAEVLRATDTVLQVDGRPTTSADALVAEIEARRPGDRLTLLVEAADGEQFTEQVTLAAREDDPDAALLGVGIETRDPEISLPFELDIDTGEVGGPSAGLALTLGLLDLLTEGELTGGRVVAATGTINLDGSVGRVGGVKQKTISARDTGVELFLVPTEEVEEARRYAEGMKVVGVTSLEDALAALRDLGGEPLPAELDLAA